MAALPGIGPSTAGFTIFSELAPELRLKIWDAAVEQLEPSFINFCSYERNMTGPVRV